MVVDAEGALLGEGGRGTSARCDRSQVELGVVGVNRVRVGVELHGLARGVFYCELTAGRNRYAGWAKAGIGVA